MAAFFSPNGHTEHTASHWISIDRGDKSKKGLKTL